MNDNNIEINNNIEFESTILASDMNKLSFDHHIYIDDATGVPQIISREYTNDEKIRIYAHANNILRIMCGIEGIKYSS